MIRKNTNLLSEGFKGLSNLWRVEGGVVENIAFVAPLGVACISWPKYYNISMSQHTSPVVPPRYNVRFDLQQIKAITAALAAHPSPEIDIFGDNVSETLLGMFALVLEDTSPPDTIHSFVL